MTSPQADASKCYESAIRLLAIREHSALELKQKLKAKGYNDALTDELLKQLADENLQSDLRYSQSLVRVRMSKGFGPVYIRNYLREKGVDSQIMESVLDFNDTAWQKALAKTALRKFGDTQPVDFKEKAKRMNFLLRRGFSSQQIRDFFDGQYDTIDDYEDQ